MSVRVGARYGSLVVVSLESGATRPPHERRWRCVCDCGGEAVRLARSLVEAAQKRQRPQCSTCAAKIRRARIADAAVARAVGVTAEQLRKALADGPKSMHELSRMFRRKFSPLSAKDRELLRDAGAVPVSTIGGMRWELRERPTCDSPCFAAGRGERLDCEGYDGCLTEFVRRYRSDAEAHCPDGCVHFVPASRLSRLMKSVAELECKSGGANHAC